MLKFRELLTLAFSLELSLGYENKKSSEPGKGVGAMEISFKKVYR